MPRSAQTHDVERTVEHACGLEFERGHEAGYAHAILAVRVILDGARARGRDPLTVLLAHIALFEEMR